MPAPPPEPYREVLVQPEDKALKVNGLNVHYLDWGGEHLPAILFLHGGSLNAHTWDTVCDLLRDRYHCIAVDLRGHGDTDWAPDGDYSQDTMRRDVEGVVQALGLENFLLVGMSLGGGVALNYAGLHSKDLVGLVIVDTGPRSLRRSDAERPNRNAIQDFVSLPPVLDTFEDFVERAVQFNPLRSREGLRRSLTWALRQLSDGRWTWKWDPDMHKRLRAGPDAEARRLQAVAAVRSVVCPTLVVRGSESPVFFPEDAEDIVADLPNGRWVQVEGAGHTVQGDRPHALTAFMEEFLARDVRWPQNVNQAERTRQIAEGPQAT